MTSLEQSLNIKDMLYIVLRSWRRIIVFAMMGALLLGGFALYRNRRTTTDSPTEPEPASEITLTKEEDEAIRKSVMANDLTVIRHNKRIEALNGRVGALIDRIDNSVYLTIDERAQPVSSFEITVTPEEPSEMAEDTLEQRRYFLGLDYLKYAKSKDFYTYLAAASEGGIDADWLHELVESKLISDNTLHVELTAPDRSTVMALSQAAQDFFLREIREKLSIDYLYQAEVSNLQSKTEDNPAIRLERETLQKELDDTIKSIRDGQAEVELIVNEALEQERLAKQAEQPVESPLEPAEPAKQNVAMFVLGGLFLGVMAAVLWAVYQAMSSEVIYDPAEFAEQLGFLYIGSIAAPGEIPAKSFGSGIDRWLERRFWGQRRGQASAQIGAPYVASVIHGLLDRDATLCASDDPTAMTSLTVAVLEDDEKFAGRVLVDAINEETGKTVDGTRYQLAGVSVQLDTEEGVKAFQTSDAAVLLLYPHETKIPQAMRTLKMADGMGKQVLGVVSAERV